jgi:hypothetical protein
MARRAIRPLDALVAGLAVVIAGVVVPFSYALEAGTCRENCVLRGFSAFAIEAEVVIAPLAFCVAGYALYLALTGRRSMRWALGALLLDVLWGILVLQIHGSDPYSLG